MLHFVSYYVWDIIGEIFLLTLIKCQPRLGSAEGAVSLRARDLVLVWGQNLTDEIQMPVTGLGVCI